MPIKRVSQKAKPDHVFGQSRRPDKMFGVGIYARVSTNDQQTLAMQNRAMREYAGRRGWMIAMQVREVGSGAAKRQARENLLEAARRARSTSCWCGAWIAGADRSRSLSRTRLHTGRHAARTQEGRKVNFRRAEVSSSGIVGNPSRPRLHLPEVCPGRFVL